MTCVEIRKVVDFIEEVRIEGGRAASPPLRMAACAAVIRNPWSGPFVEDLRPAIMSHASTLAHTLVPRLVGHFQDAKVIEAYGKSGIVGVNGEIEHAAAMIHTLHFGNVFRAGAEGDAYLSFTNKRNGPGCAIVVPLTHKTSEKRGRRSHFLTLEFSIPDAPGPDEIIVALAASDGGRPHHRIGDRITDMREMGVDQTGVPLTSS